MITCAKRFQDSEHGLIDDNNMYAKVTVESAAPVKVDNSLFILNIEHATCLHT